MKKDPFVFEIDMSVPNKNGRIYCNEGLKEAVAKYQDRIDEGRAICQITAPDAGVVDLMKASHKITEMEVTPEGKLNVEFVTYDTEQGLLLESMLGMDAVDITTTGFGNVDVQDDGTYLVTGYSIDCISFVPLGEGSQIYKRIK